MKKDFGDKIENFIEKSKDKKDFELSPGEKLIILSNFWKINAEHFKNNPPRVENAYNKNKILLLDEVDAHMHPRLIRDFMDILKNGDIHYLGFQVFMTTHNPITVTFTPKENLFEMKYENDRYSIEKVNFRRHGLKALTDDLVPNFNYKPIKIVYVEGMDDLKFYNFIYNRSFEDNLLDEDVDELQLKFMCTTDGKKDLEFSLQIVLRISEMRVGISPGINIPPVSIINCPFTIKKLPWTYALPWNKKK